MSNRITKNYSKIIQKNDIEKSIKEAKEELKELIRLLLCGNLTFVYNNKICTATPLDFHRVLSEWNRKSKVDNCIRQIILSSFFSAEEKMICSGLISCAMWINSIEQFEEKNKVCRDDIFSVIDCWIPSGISNQITKNIFTVGGIGSDVLLEESKYDPTSITVIKGQSFVGNIENIFQIKNNLNNYKEKMSIIAIDGIVETVSQLESLFE